MEPVLNDYNNTAELLTQFPVEYPTPVESSIERNIQNRLLTGFANWNRGYAAWKAWGDILYTPDSLYNVHAVHLTLSEYQMAMQATLRATDIQMGAFHHMIVCGDWTAIYYDTVNIRRDTGERRPASVMEFVHFRDYGPDLGTRVVEGWAGTRGPDFDGLQHFQTPEEQQAQQMADAAIAATVIPDTDDLAVKYPVRYPTPMHAYQGARMQARILQDFEAWNQPGDGYLTWAEGYFSDALQYVSNQGTLDKAQYLASCAKAREQRLYFENMLLSGDWAAIHYRTRDAAGVPGSRMQFLHFDGEQVTQVYSK